MGNAVYLYCPHCTYQMNTTNPPLNCPRCGDDMEIKIPPNPSEPAPLRIFVKNNGPQQEHNDVNQGVIM